MQYGALTPFCRNHSMMGNVDQYAWSWGETVLGHVREAIELRYRLLPYLYASFVRAAETGAPVQRPLVFDFQRDAAVRDIDDEYLLGPDLLVAPVLEPGATARQVYLPAGDWYDWHTGERHAGGRWVVAPTPMERIPLYARAGAVVPMWAQAPPSTSGYHPARRRAAPVRAGRRRRVDVAAAGGRRAHARGARGRLPADDVHGRPRGRRGDAARGSRRRRLPGVRPRGLRARVPRGGAGAIEAGGEAVAVRDGRADRERGHGVHRALARGGLSSQESPSVP